MNATNKTRLLVIAACLCAGFSVYSQTSSQASLEKKRTKLVGKIKTTTTLLNSTRKDKKVAVSDLVTIKKQIGYRERLIQNIHSEIFEINEKSEEARKAIALMEQDLDSLKEQYTQLVREGYRLNRNQNDLLFVLSAKSFNDGYRRVRFLKHLKQSRVRQAAVIKDTQTQLRYKIEEHDRLIALKTKLLKSQEHQNESLVSEKKKKDKVVNSLKSRERKLSVQLSKQRRDRKRLSSEIERLIKRAIAGTSNSSKAIPLTPEQKRLANKFRNNRGRLPWPVSKGVITSTYGEQPHPTLRNIKIKNNGIDITTTRDSDVRAVFNGKVTAVSIIPGYQKVVMVRHGEYYTVYSHLKETYVVVGEDLNTKQSIGMVATNADEGKALVHFEIWKNKTRMDPETWVASR